LALSTAVFALGLRFVHYFRPDLIPWRLKSAYPLMLAGAGFACMQFAIPRTRTQITLGLIVSAAFILWGVEQFLSNQAVASIIDDLVVFLFVLDLSIVIRGHLKSQPGTTTL
jgi:hypothetical protein